MGWGWGDGWVLMGGIFLEFKEFFLEGVWPPPHKISVYTPLPVLVTCIPPPTQVLDKKLSQKLRSQGCSNRGGYEGPPSLTLSIF